MAQDQAEMLLSSDEEADEPARWTRRLHRIRERSESLARVVGHKNAAWALSISGGQVSKELSGLEGKNQSLGLGLYLASATRDEHLAGLVSEAIGCRMLEWPKQLSAEQELKAIKDALSRHGRIGQLVIEEALGGRR